MEPADVLIRHGSTCMAKGNPVLSDAGAENQLSLKGISGVQALYICPVGNLYLLPGKRSFPQKKTAMGGIGDPFYPAPILCCYDQLSPDIFPGLCTLPDIFPGQQKTRNLVFKSSIYQLFYSSLQCILPRYLPARKGRENLRLIIICNSSGRSAHLLR